MTDSLATLAGEAAGYFETRTRGEGADAETFVGTRDGRPDWLTDLIYAAHGDMFPDDWRYAAIASALEFIAEQGEDAEDGGGEWADSEVDVYNGARLAWLGSNLSRAGYCDEAAEEFGGEYDTFERIGLGQYAEASEVFGLVLQGLRDRLEELEAIEEDEVPA